ncbi:hypothetical protein J5N97_002020 [Dioscorea zingiberensis]|uniref:Serine/threonine-protein kinase BSK1-like TPR repeats domain-containing protein n=1 Tax=Dioscorea zingiberensis TaxID=325984 RepID=A0A9D5BSU5_9LILI|nr:hypothetical protein J5N97_002020 [Dioscorea zingiberensis]
MWTMSQVCVENAVGRRMPQQDFTQVAAGMPRCREDAAGLQVAAQDAAGATQAMLRGMSRGLGDKQPLPWEMRVRVVYYIAQALDHCNTENRKIYHDLNAYRVLFDEDSFQYGYYSRLRNLFGGLSCFNGPPKNKNTVVVPTMLSPLGKACARMDLTAVHDILLKTGYRDEEGAENELSFQEWTQQVQDMLNTKKFGDIAFRDKDFKNAIEYYSKLIVMMSVPSATVFARRAFSYLMNGQAELALRDAMQAQVCIPEWPTAFLLAGPCTLKARNGD